MTTSEEPRIRKPGRPRSEQAHQAILDAALDLMAEKGFELMSMEEIAERAGVGKTTIYRRWPAKIDLAVEALKHLHMEFALKEDSGNLRADFINILRMISHFNVSRFGTLYLKLANELHKYPELAEIVRTRLAEPRMQRMHEMIERAKARGEIRSDVDSTLVMELLGGPFMYRQMMGDTAAITEAWAERVVDALFNGLRPREKESQG